MNVGITHNLEALARVFDPKKIKDAEHIAINKTTQKTRTQVSKAVRARYVVTAKDVSSTVKITKTTDDVAGRILMYTGKKLSLNKFSLKKVKTRKRGDRRGGVSVKVLRKGKRKVIRGKYGFGAFLAPAGGGLKVFERMSKSRLPIKRVSGLAIPQMVTHKSVINALYQTVEAVYPEELDRALDFKLGAHR